MIHLETERLLLRDWQDGDLAPFAALNADPRVMEFFPARLTRGQSDRFAARIRANLARLGYGLYAVEVKETRGFIGFVDFAHPAMKAHFTPCIEIGWRLAFDAWGRGHASEAARACLAHGFSQLGFEEVMSFTARRNARSIAVMERIGMTRDRDGDSIIRPCRTATPCAGTCSIGSGGRTAARDTNARRGRLRGLEPSHRPALAHHVHRYARPGKQRSNSPRDRHSTLLLPRTSDLHPSVRSQSYIFSTSNMQCDIPHIHSFCYYVIYIVGECWIQVQTVSELVLSPLKSTTA